MLNPSLSVVRTFQAPPVLWPFPPYRRGNGLISTAPSERAPLTCPRTAQEPPLGPNINLSSLPQDAVFFGSLEVLVHVRSTLVLPRFARHRRQRWPSRPPPSCRASSTCPRTARATRASKLWSRTSWRTAAARAAAGAISYVAASTCLSAACARVWPCTDMPARVREVVGTRQLRERVAVCGSVVGRHLSRPK